MLHHLKTKSQKGEMIWGQHRSSWDYLKGGLLHLPKLVSVFNPLLPLSSLEKSCYQLLIWTNGKHPLQNKVTKSISDRLVCHKHFGDNYVSDCWKYYKESGLWWQVNYIRGYCGYCESICLLFYRWGDWGSKGVVVPNGGGEGWFRIGKTAEDKPGGITYESSGNCEDKTGKVPWATPSCAISRQVPHIFFW